MSAVLEKTIVKKMSAEEFEASPFAETHELIRGELQPIMPAGSLHGFITNSLNVKAFSSNKSPKTHISCAC